MFRLLFAQLKKLFLRTDVKWILAVFALLPFGIAALIRAESGIIQIGSSVFNALGYASVVVGLLGSLLLINVCVALTAASLVSREIDSGLDSMYVAKVRSRGQILLSKLTAMDMLIFAIFLALAASAVAGWFVFLKDSPFGTAVFWAGGDDELFTLVYTVVGSLFETLAMSRVFILFSVLFKYGKAVIFNFVTIVVLKLLANIELLQKWIPSYIGAGTHLAQYSGEALLREGMYSIALLAGYALVLSIVDYMIYRRMDLSR